MKRWTLATLAVVLFAAPAFSQKLPVTVRSPDGRIAVTVDRNDGGNLTYSIERNGETVIATSQLRLGLVEGDVSSVEVRGFTPRSVNDVHKLVATKAAQAVDRFDELTVEVAPRSGAVSSLRWIFRAYDDGVAFRYLVPAGAGLKTLQVRNEETEFKFGADYACHGFNVGRFDSSHEGEFDPVRASLIREHHTYDLPLVCRTGKNAFAIAEANLRDYGGLYLAGRGEGRPGVQSRLSRRLDDRSLIARVDIGAAGAGSPWRVIMLADKLGTLIESNLIGNLNPPPSFDTAWIKPGKTAWDWWSGPYLPPPDKGGTDMPTIKTLHRFRGPGRLRIHDDRRGLVPEFGRRRQRARRRGRHPGQAGDRHAGAGRLRGEEEGGAMAVGAVVAARPPDGCRAGAVPEMGHQGHQGRLHGPQRPADGRLLPQADAQGRRAQVAGGHARRLSAGRPEPHLS